MSRINQHGEEVRGQVIGDVYGVRAMPEYEGRPQGEMVYAKTEADAVAQCREQIETLKAETGKALQYIYPGEWSVRIYD